MMSLFGLIPTVFAQENIDVMNSGIEVSDKADWLWGGFLAVLIFVVIVGLIATIFWIWMLVDAITKPIENKAIWILVLLIFQAIGAIVYYFAVKRPFDAGHLPVAPTTPTLPQ